MNEREVVLPSGKFARLRPLKGRDFFTAQKRVTADHEIGIILLSMSAIIDDKPITISDLEELDLRDLMALMQELNKHITGPVT